MLSQIDLRVLLSIDAPRIREAARTESLALLELAGLVSSKTVDDQLELTLTERGEAYISAMQRLPLPEQRTQWVVPSKADEAREAAIRG